MILCFSSPNLWISDSLFGIESLLEQTVPKTWEIFFRSWEPGRTSSFRMAEHRVLRIAVFSGEMLFWDELECICLLSDFLSSEPEWPICFLWRFLSLFLSCLISLASLEQYLTLWGSDIVFKDSLRFSWSTPLRFLAPLPKRTLYPPNLWEKLNCELIESPLLCFSILCGEPRFESTVEWSSSNLVGWARFVVWEFCCPVELIFEKSMAWLFKLWILAEPTSLLKKVGSCSAAPADLPKSEEEEPVRFFGWTSEVLKV